MSVFSVGCASSSLAKPCDRGNGKHERREQTEIGDNEAFHPVNSLTSHPADSTICLFAPQWNGVN